MSDEIAYLSATDLLTEFRAMRLSPVDAVRTAFDRIARYEERLNAFCYLIDEEEALAAARESQERWRKGEPRGRLEGLPITVKDAILAKGWPTLRGSKTIDPNQPWVEDAPAVARAREHGAIILGKTTTPEFGWKGVTDSPLTGITRNPWNLDRTPGGSSGGSAAALAAGIGHASIGTDAGGSVRIPASFSGLVAIKATLGRVPTYPPSAIGTLGHIGPITRTVADAALMLTVMSEPDARDWTSLPQDGIDYSQELDRSVEGVRVAFSPNLGYARVEPEVAEIVSRAAKAFAELGATVDIIEAPFPDPTRSFRTHFLVGCAHSTRALTPDQRSLLDPDFADMLSEADGVGLEDFLVAVDERAALGRNNNLFHKTYDLLLTPTLATAAFPVGRIAPQGYDEKNWLSWALTFPFNLTGQPTATVPCGLTQAGLPVGLQIVGPMYKDDLVLRAAKSFEAAHPNTHRHPPI